MQILVTPLPPVPTWNAFRVLPPARGEYNVRHDTGTVTVEWFDGKNWPTLKGVWSAQAWSNI